MTAQNKDGLRQLYAEFDGHQSKLLRKRGIKLTCKAGCFACCREPVYVERHEAELMLSTLSEAERAEVAELTRQWLEKADAAGIVAATESDAFRYRAAILWCPLLKDGRCRAYAERPIACRGHITNRSKRGCEDDEQRRTQKFILMPELIEWGARQVLGTTAEAGGMLEYDHLGVHLARALLGSKARSGVGHDVIITHR